MSADMYENCPKCKEEDSVRIDGLWDIELHEDGHIIFNTHGKCSNCGMEFK